MLTNILKKNSLHILMIMLGFCLLTPCNATIQGAGCTVSESADAGLRISAETIHIIVEGLATRDMHVVNQFIAMLNYSEEHKSSDFESLLANLTPDIKNMCFSFDSDDNAFKLADTAGNTLLHIICAEGYLQSDGIIESLITPENIGHQNSDGDTPLHLACKAACYDTVGVLITNSAPVHIENNSGKIPSECVPAGYADTMLILNLLDSDDIYAGDSDATGGSYADDEASSSESHN